LERMLKLQRVAFAKYQGQSACSPILDTSFLGLGIG
jgi:hypothetical protein